MQEWDAEQVDYHDFEDWASNTIAKAFSRSVRQATVVLFDQGFCSIANFLTGVLVARACTKAEYGLYVLGFTLLMTAMGIQASLSGIPFTVFSPRLRDKGHRLYLGSTFIQHLAVSAIAAVAFVVGAAVLFAVGRTDNFAGVLLALAVACVFVLLRDFMRYVLLAQLRVWASLLMGLVANIATVGILLLAYRGGWLRAPVAYLILGGCSGLPVLVLLLRERSRITFATNKLREHLKENWKFGKWLIARTAAFFFAVQIYPLALMFFKGPGATAVYGACMSLAASLNPLFVGIERYLRPKTSHVAATNPAALPHIVFVTIGILIVPLVGLLIIAVYCGDLVLVLVFGSKYIGCHDVLVVCVVALIANVVFKSVSIGIDSMGATRVTFSGRVIGAIASLLFGIPLVILAGSYGAAFGVMISHCVAGAYWWKEFKKLSAESM